MGMMTTALKKIGLIEDEDAESPAEKKKKMEEAQERLAKRAAQNKGKPLNKFQDEVEKLTK